MIQQVPTIWPSPRSQAPAWERTLWKLCFPAGCIQPAMVLVCVATGLASGAFAGTIGYYLFRYIERGGSIPGVEDGLIPLVLDSILLTIGSWALAIPTGMVLLLARPKTQTWDPKLLFVAGIVSGVSIPILMSVAFPYVRSDVFPPKGFELTLVWLGVVGALLGVAPYLPKRKTKFQEQSVPK